MSNDETRRLSSIRHAQQSNGTNDNTVEFNQKCDIQDDGHKTGSNNVSARWQDSVLPIQANIQAHFAHTWELSPKLLRFKLLRFELYPIYKLRYEVFPVCWTWSRDHDHILILSGIYIRTKPEKSSCKYDVAKKCSGGIYRIPQSERYGITPSTCIVITYEW